jgi:DNA-binding transcriptional LysR family regulator
MIDPRRLGILLAVATHGSVIAAATSLHLTPPAVSQQLMALERETRVGLIDRSGRQVRLTAAGRLLARHGESVAAQLREAEHDLARLTGHASGLVRLGAFQSVMSYLVGPVLLQLAEDHPSIEPSVLECYGPSAIAALKQGDLEIVLTEYDTDSRPPTEPGLGVRELLFDPYLLVTPRDWTTTIDGLADFAVRPWVSGPPGTACDQAFRRLSTAAGFTERPRDVCVEFPSVLALVAAGRGASIIPKMALTRAAINTHALPELGGRHIAALYQITDTQPTPATEVTLEVLSQIARTATTDVVNLNSNTATHKLNSGK